MNPRIADLLARLQNLENELELELQSGRLLHGFSVTGKRVTFERGARDLHRSWRINLIPYLKGTTFASLLSAPLIYSLIVPVALFDLWLNVYQQICFRALGIALVPRSEYIVIDRQHLAYLNGLEIFNCVYCGYANGVIGWAREIAGRTEQYWCPIKHASRVSGPHNRYQAFLPYGDAEGYRLRLADYREQLMEPAAKPEI